MSRQDFITKFRKEHQRMPTAEEMAKTCNVSVRTAQHEIVSYVRSKREAKKEGPVKKQKTAVTDKKSIIFYLKICLYFLACMAFCLSVYFTGLWFSDRFHIVIAGVISLTMVLFMVIAPQTLRFIENPLVKGIAGFSFAVALVFSMGSTLAGQYNKTTEKQESVTDKSFEYSTLVKSEAEKEELISAAKEDKAVHQETIKLLSSTEEKRIENFQSIATERKYIQAFDERIDSLTTELEEIRSKQITNGGVTENRDFYLFLSGLTGADVSRIEFLVSALPAIFIDIISALCLNLALFLKEKKG